MKITILDMGGAINGIVDPEAPTPSKSIVVPYLKNLSEELGIQFYSKVIALKDSRAIDNEDREQLAEAVLAAKSHHILIPHGTFTMPETGEFLQNILAGKLEQHFVVLVGSKVPLGESNSDAPENLQFAVETLRDCPPGIWIAMEKRLWDPKKVVKDRETGTFVAKQ